MSKFRVGDMAVHNEETRADLTHGKAYEVIAIGRDDISIRDDRGDLRRRSVDRFDRLPETKHSKSQRLILAKEAELARLKAAVAKRAEDAAKRKAKAERAKAVKGLTPAGRRVVAMLQAGAGNEFGCQRESVIALVAAITGDKVDALKKAIAK